MALKECIRARAAGAIHSHQHVYRKSKLTMALKNSFHLPHARTIVIATVSPASKDTEHSLNTLRHACVMQGEGGGDEGSSATGGESRFITGGKMTTEQIGEVNIAQIARRNFEKKKTQGELDGLKTSSGNTLDSKLARAANKEIEITDKMKRKMRRMAENRSFAALDEPIKQIILFSRQKLGQDERQLARIQLSSQFHHLYPDEDTDPTIPEETNEEEVEDDDEDLDTDQAPAVDDDIDSFHASLPKPEQFSQQTHNNNRKDLKSIDRANLDNKYYEDDFESSTPALQQRPGSSSGTANKPNLSHKYVPPIDGIAAANSQPQRPTTPSKSIPTPMNGNVSASYSSSFARVPYQKIHDSIFIAKDSIPLPILLMQLRAMLQVHNYSAAEIESFILGENGPVKHSRPVTPKISIPVPPVSSSSSQKRSTTPQRPSSASSRQSQSHQYHNNQQQQQTPQTMTPRSSERSSRPSSKALPSSSVFVSSAAAAILGSGGNSTRTPSRSNSTSRIRGSEANSNESKGKEKTNNKEDKYQQMKQQYEDELNQKKQRQEQAKQVRDQAEKQKRDQIMAKQQPTKRSSLENKPLPNEHFELMQLQKEIDFHSSEAHKLSQQLEKDMLCKDADAKLSMAQKFGVKKQLSLHKAALLKLERKKTEKDTSPIPEPQPSSSKQRQQTPELNDFGGSHIGMVRNSFGEDDFIVGKRETPTVIETRSSSRGQSNPVGQTGSQRYSGVKSFGGYHQEPEEEKGWNFDADPKSKKVLTKYEVDNEDQDNNNEHYESNTVNDQKTKNRYPLPSQEDRDDLPVLSEKGRPLSLRMAVQYQNRNYSNNY
jgi:hypothetical protein